MKIMTERRKKEILKLIDNLYFEFGTKNPISICKGLGIEIVSANIERFIHCCFEFKINSCSVFA